MPATTTPTPHDEERVTFSPPAVEIDGPRPNLRVVTVFSAKGGAGATVVATNLALALCETGARVCLLDLAVAFGDVAVSLQLAPRRSLVDALEVGTTNDSVTELVTVHASGLHCVLSPVDPTGVERMPTEVVRRLIGALRSAYDVVVIDTASELSEHVLEAIDASDRLLLVTTPEIPAVKNTRIALDMLDLVGHPREQSHVVLNLFDPLFGLTVQDVRTALQIEPTLCLQLDNAVRSSVNTGVPLVASHPTNPVATALREYALREILGSTETSGKEGHRFRLRRRSA